MSSVRLRGQAAAAANILALLDGSAICEAHRWCDHVQDAYSLRCAAQVHGAARDLIEHVAHTASVELNAATDNPLVFPEDGVVLSNGNFHGQPVAFALDVLALAVSELASISERQDRTARQPRALRWTAGVPRGGRRPQLRFHDPAVRRRLARQREQGAQPSRERGLDPDERRPGGSCVDGQRGRAEGVAGACERGARRRDRAPRRSAGGRVPRAARAGRRCRGPRGSSCASVSPRLGDDRSLSDDIEAVAAAIRDGSADRGGRSARRASCNEAAARPPIPEAPVPRQRALLRRSRGRLRPRRRRSTGRRPDACAIAVAARVLRRRDRLQRGGASGSACGREESELRDGDRHARRRPSRRCAATSARSARRAGRS